MGVRAAADDPADTPQARRNKAIDKGVEWLRSQQAADGSWDYGTGPFKMPIHMKAGMTGLSALALLKSGVATDDAAVEKAFAFMATAPIEHTYSAACVLLAIEARANWEPPRFEDEEPKAPKGGGKKWKLTARDLEVAQRCVDFLAKCRNPSSWSYPKIGKKPGDPDLSNTHYALLGLDAAERVSIPVPKECYEKALDWILGAQEKDGPEVESFPVPGADLSYKELRKIEKELKDKIKQIESSFKGKKPGEAGANGHTEADEVRTTEEDAAHKLLKTTVKTKMHARGFWYAILPADLDATEGHEHFQAFQRKATASMTTAGLASLALCKSHLEGTNGYEKNWQTKIDTAIRDGAAWLAKNFSVTSNLGMTGSPPHVDYYLYGLERSGIMLLCPRFGEHDWYDEGSRSLVQVQAANGSWDAGANGTLGAVPDTCFALLFLARGTTPIVKIPTKTATGTAGQDGK